VSTSRLNLRHAARYVSTSNLLPMATKCRVWTDWRTCLRGHAAHVCERSVAPDERPSPSLWSVAGLREPAAMGDVHRLVLFGAGDWAEWADPLLSELASGGGHAAVVAAGQVESGEDAIRWYRDGVDTRLDRVGIASVHVPLLDPGDGDTHEAVDVLEAAAFVYVLGGGPRSTVAALRGSRFWRTLVDRRVPYVGSSGGAMLVGGRYPTDLGFTAVEPGLGRNPRVVVAGHWDELDEMRAGLRQSFVLDAGRDVLIGIDRDTGLDGDGTHWQVVGRGTVTLHVGAQVTFFSPGDEFDSPESIVL
jgi:cyanophycinase-like exopeptidase